MMHIKSASDITSSSAPSSPSRSPKRPVYFVQSPSRDSHDDDKSSIVQATPNFSSPMESPSHPSYGRHSRTSSGSRFSGIFRSSSSRKGNRKRNDKGWPQCNVILEEGDYDEIGDEMWHTRRCRASMLICGLILLFTLICLVLWGAGRPYKPEITVKSLAVNYLYVGTGSDFTGVPTKIFTMNCTLRMSVYNTATFYGIHVSSNPVKLMFSDMAVATGQLKKYYQPKKSHRNVLVNVHGSRVPLYGAGSSLAPSSNGRYQVPLRLEFDVRSQGNVVGKLARVKHRRKISCTLVVDSSSNKPVKLKKGSCVYN